MAYFFNDLRNCAINGPLSRSSFALMEDWPLMYNAYKQIYGSQISNGEHYNLKDPQTVDERRAAIGLGPLSDYLLHFDLDYDTEMERMKSD